MDLSEHDFDLMYEAAMAWGPDWAAHDGRFIDVHSRTTSMPPYDMRMAYWFGQRWVEVMLAQMFLDQEGFRYRTLWDTTVHPSGVEMGYVIVSDYVSKTLLAVLDD